MKNNIKSKVKISYKVECYLDKTTFNFCKKIKQNLGLKKYLLLKTINNS